MSRDFFSEFKKSNQETEEEKLKSESKSENLEEKGRELNPREIEILGEEINEYVQGLKYRIEEIEAELKTSLNEERAGEFRGEMEELQEQYDGLAEMTEDINTGNFENITKKPVKK